MVQSPRPSQRDRAATEGAILEAARRCFARYGYEKSTLRKIGAEAKIDASLVIQYFGSKAQLFQRVVDIKSPLSQAMEFEGGVGAGIATAFLHSYEGEAAWAESALGVLRSAATEPAAAEVLRTTISRLANEAIAPHVNGPDGELRVAMIGAMLLGLLSARHLVDLSAVRNADIEELIHYAGRAFQAVLTGPGPDREQ